MPTYIWLQLLLYASNKRSSDEFIRNTSYYTCVVCAFHFEADHQQFSEVISHRCRQIGKVSERIWFLLDFHLDRSYRLIEIDGSAEYLENPKFREHFLGRTNETNKGFKDHNCV